MSNTYSDATSSSTSSFVTSLIINSAIAGGELAAFVSVRRWFKAIYEPRTYIPPKKLQASVLGKHLLWPIWRIIWADPEEILEKNGVDPYVFVRWLYMMSKAMIPIWLLSWVILLPVDAVDDTTDGKTGLDKFTFGNVTTTQTNRFWAHLVLSYLFVFWVIFLIWGEMKNWLVLRQKYLIDPAHSKLARARTVLITGVPPEFMDELKLIKLYSKFPGGVRRVWLARDLKEMPGLWSRRAYAASKLEAAEVKLIKLALYHRTETAEKIAKLKKKGKPIPAHLIGPVNPQLLELKPKSPEDSRASDENVNVESLGLADQLVPRGKRPMMRLKPSWAPFSLSWLGIGEKVDTIDWARKEIAEVMPALEQSRQQLKRDSETPGPDGDMYPPLSSAFILFNQQIAAHMATQMLAHHVPFTMSSRLIEQSPDNVIWHNLSMNAYEANVRRGLSIAATAGLIIGWAFPIAFIGALSNISTLTQTYSWLSWIQGTSPAKHLLQGIISGVLPPVLLAVLMALLPAILRRLAQLEGIPSKSNVELDLMTRYFVFMVVHTFFIVTLSSGLISSIAPLAENPSSAALILAKQMPMASTFFITLILTQFTGTAGTLLQPITLAITYVKIFLLGGSPRSVFKTRYSLQTTSWGTEFPGVTVYAVIILAYSVISPIINGFGAAFFLLSAIVYKYLFIWVYDQPADEDTGGAFFPMAISHVFVGLYIEELCQTALFFLWRDQNGNAAAIPQAVLTIVLIVITAGAQFMIDTSYRPVKHTLPMSLSHLSYGVPEEEKQPKGEMRMNGDGTVPQPIINVSTDGLLDSRKASMSLSDITSTSSFKFPSRHLSIIPDQESDDKPLIREDGLPDKPPSALGLATSPGPPVGEMSDEEKPVPDPLADPEQQIWSENEDPFFALPGGPGVQKVDSADDDDPNAFFHPATKEPMRVLWLPKDDLGLCEAEMEINAKFGIQCTTRGAVLSDKGKVHISGPPPDDL